MRLLLASTAVALLIGLSPASAAMCGGGGGQQQSMMGGGSSGGMCGAGGTKNMSEWPARDADGQRPAEKQAMGMCGCCRDMAMMGGKADDPHKGMEMPKQ